MFNLNAKDLMKLGEYLGTPSFPLAAILINVLVAFLCGLWIYFVYKKTYTGVLFSKNLGIAMIIVPVLTSLIVMTITGNLALSLGMIGALSIIRFRTPLKDPKDLAYVFWAVTSGVICGVSAYPLAVVSALAIGACLWALSKRSLWKAPYLLVIHADQHETSAFPEILRRHCARFKERSSTLTDDHAEFVYEVTLKDGSSHDLLREIRSVTGVSKTVMVSYEGDLDEPR